MLISCNLNPNNRKWSSSWYTQGNSHNALNMVIDDQSNIYALRDLVPFVKFEKREKQPWRSATFSKGAN